MSSISKVFMLSILRDQAYLEPNLNLRLTALKFYRDEIDKIPENMFHHKDLDADIEELEIKVRRNK